MKTKKIRNVRNVPIGKKNNREVKTGAPTKYDERFTPKLAGWLARDGLTNEQISQELEISSSTLALWCKKYPTLSDAIKKGKDVVDREVEDSLLRRAMGYEYEKEEIEVSTVEGEKEKVFSKKKTTTMHVPGDVVACIFWLKNRKPTQWRERRTDIDFDRQKGEITELFDTMRKEKPVINAGST